MNTFAACVSTLAKDRGITIKHLAERIGVSRSTVRRMMNDDSLSNSGKQLFAIALGVTLEDVVEICRLIDEMEDEFPKQEPVNG
jgi:transcriptional regulator with XRE-family HTH domain